SAFRNSAAYSASGQVLPVAEKQATRMVESVGAKAASGLGCGAASAKAGAAQSASARMSADIFFIVSDLLQNGWYSSAQTTRGQIFCLPVDHTCGSFAA